MGEPGPTGLPRVPPVHDQLDAGQVGGLVGREVEDRAGHLRCRVELLRGDVPGHRRERLFGPAVPGGQVAEEVHRPHIGVLTPPRVMTLTRTPFRASWHSMAATLERRRTAALAAPYALAPANGLTPETEATLTMLPPPACMAGMPCRITRNTLSRFTART